MRVIGEVEGTRYLLRLVPDGVVEQEIVAAIALRTEKGERLALRRPDEDTGEYVLEVVKNGA